MKSTAGIVSAGKTKTTSITVQNSNSAMVALKLSGGGINDVYTIQNGGQWKYIGISDLSTIFINSLNAGVTGPVVSCTGTPTGQYRISGVYYPKACDPSMKPASDPAQPAAPDPDPGQVTNQLLNNEKCTLYNKTGTIPGKDYTQTASDTKTVTDVKGNAGTWTYTWTFRDRKSTRLNSSH